jgi:hypothetical protein
MIAIILRRHHLAEILGAASTGLRFSVCACCGIVLQNTSRKKLKA